MPPLNGQAQKPTAATLTILALIEPITGMETLNLPEGWRDKGAITIWSEILLQIADDQKGQLGDRVSWNGYIYEVRLRADWERPVFLNNLEYIAFKQDRAQ